MRLQMGMLSPNYGLLPAGVLVYEDLFGSETTTEAFFSAGGRVEASSINRFHSWDRWRWRVEV